jgi:Uma2 family endonuclease
MMATVTEPLEVDQSVCITATWEADLALLEARGERNRPKYIFIDGRMTVVSPSRSHEETKKRLGWMFEEILLDLEIDFHSSGEVTLLNSQGSRAGTEGDESYYQTNIDRVWGKKELVMGEDPPPDLIIEVVGSHSEDDAFEAHQRIRIREVWVPRSGGLHFVVLGQEGRYTASPTSGLLPFLAADDLVPWLYRQDIASDAKLRELFRQWVIETLGPRYRSANET